MIKACLHKAKLDIGNLSDTLEKMDEAAYANFTRTKTIQCKTLIDAPYHSTICGDCNHVCHDHCGLHELSKGSNQFTGCSAFRLSDNCNVCESMCSFTRHYHGRKTIILETKTVEEILHDDEDKHTAAQGAVRTARQSCTTFAAAKANIEGPMSNVVKELERSCRDIMQRCSGFSLVDELAMTIKRMEKEARLNSKNLIAREIAERNIQEIRNIVDRLNRGVPASSASSDHNS